MARNTKAPPVKVTPDMVDKASRTSAVLDLVKLADAFTRAGAHGPFTTVLPLFTSVSVKDKGYRRHNVPAGTRVQSGEVRLGKRDGLIFVFPLADAWTCDKGAVEWIEMSWDDVINSFDGLADRVEGYLSGSERSVVEVEQAVVQAIKANPAMHKVLGEGFLAAQAHKRQSMSAETIEANPMFGIF